ncbi:MAG TPA: hypothetical protein VII11_11155 [Bacteroidota bacterium]
MKSIVLLSIGAVILTCSIGACSGSPKASAIAVIDSTGGGEVRGEVSFNRNGRTGAFEPDIWKEGNLFFYRAPKVLEDGFSAKAGVFYRVTKDLKLEEVGTFYVTAPTDQLVAKYVQ